MLNCTKPYLFALLGMFCTLAWMLLSSQTIYFNTISGNVYSFNLATCTATQISNGPAFNDMAIGPNGLIYGLAAQSIWIIDPAAGTSTLLVTINSAIATSLEYGIDGQLYLMGLGVWQVDPISGAWQFNGNLPAGWDAIGDLVYYDGIYYGTVSTPVGASLASINLTNPATSTIIGPLPAGNFVGGAAVDDENCPKLYWFSTILLTQPSQLMQYDLNTQTWTSICPNFSLTVGGADAPNDYAFPLSCPCTTFAGTVNNQTFNNCVPGTVTVPANNNAVLDPDDILRYILFSNPADTFGSIVLQSSSATIAFNPATMQTGTTYYLATLAGNNLGGNVDLNDPCLDVSDVAAQVIWRDQPSVAFAVNNPNVCAGACTNVTATFTGAAPFILTYSSPVTGSATQTFSGNTGTFQVCTLPGSAPGSLVVQATNLSDAWCTCQ